MRAALERLEKNQVSLQIEVEEDRVAEALSKAYRNVVKKVSIPGFRKGKVPRPILEARLGKQVLYEEALDILLPEAYEQALKEHDLEPVNQPQVDVDQMEEGKPLLFKVTVEVTPEVKLGTYKGVEAVRPEVKVGDEEVEAQLKLLQERNARLVDAAPDAVVNDGDFAVVDSEATVDGKPEERLSGKGQYVEVGAQRFIPGFEANLLGMKIGEEKEFTLHLPSLYKYPDLEGKEAVFKVVLTGIKQKELSPIDDDFAREVSECESLDQLKEQLRNKLEEMGNLNARRIFTERVVSKVVEQAEVDIPEIMVKRQAEQDTHEFVSRLAYQRLNLEDYLKLTNKDMDSLRQDLEERAKATVKRRLVLKAIAKAEGIRVGDEELEAEVNDLAAQYNLDTAELRQSLEAKGQLSFIEESLLFDKVQKFLAEHAVELPDKEEEPSPEAEKAEDQTEQAG